MNIRSIIDKEFYEKVVPIAENAQLIAEKKPSLDSDMYKIHSEAVKCFFQQQYLETVFFASIGVERCLNKKLHKKKWINLNPLLIKEAFDTKITAVTELLDDSEKGLLQTDNPKPHPKPLFCIRRNKILHGEFEGLAEAKAPEIEDVTALYSKYAGTEIEKETHAFVIRYNMSAYDQLIKFQKFLIKI